MTARQSRWYSYILSFAWPIPAVFAVSFGATMLPSGSMSRLLLTATALLFLPGYALTLLVFPGGRRRQTRGGPMFRRDESDSRLSSLEPLERIALAVGFSVCLIPVYGFLVAITGLVYDVQSAIILLSATTTALAVLGFGRYLLVSEEVAPPTPFAELASDISTLDSSSTSHGRLLNVAVVVAILLVAAQLTAAVAVPTAEPEYSTAALLTETEDGDLVAADYPGEVQEGDSSEFVFRLENNERQTVDYHVVVQMQRVNEEGDVVERDRIYRFNQSLAPGQAWEHRHRITSTMSGERTRFVYLVYRGPIPNNPAIDSAYRSLTLWVGSEQPDGENAADDDAAADDEAAAALSGSRDGSAPSVPGALVDGHAALVPSGVYDAAVTCEITKLASLDARCN